MVDAVNTYAGTSSTKTARASLSANLETFLTLLTTQLKNQDPLSPLDSNEFTAQLTQMAGVEQQLLTNDLLTNLLTAQQSQGMTGASSYIGKEVTAVWAADKLTDGKASWSYELGASASSVTLQVVDGTGKTVWTGDAPAKSEGVHDFTWNGQTTAGGQAADGGVYTLKITAKNGANTITSQVLTRGQVSGVELYDGTPYLNVGNSIVPLSTVIALKGANQT